jgi:outer membrane receptor protein involved in Fe transport
MHSRVHVRNLLALGCAAAIASFSVSAQSAAPAQDDAKNAAAAKKLEQVTVTGTRISNPNVVSPTPITVLTADDIKSSGAVNLGDVLTTMPQLATTFTMGNSTRFIGTAGVQLQDLRNLGTSRTLVLVNGRRFVGASAGDTAVDVNVIPADWIERVEIITGGASAVYGADAVTGVINFILKKNYQGATLHAQYGTSEHGGFNRGMASISGGMNFADNRGNIGVSVEHSDNSSLEFPDRFGNRAYSSLINPDGPPDTILTPNAGSYTITNGGTFSLGRSTALGQRYVFNPDGSVRPQRFGGLADAAGRCTDCDRLDANQVLQLQPRYNRTTLSSVASFDINDEHRLYAEGTYSHVNVKTFSQPAFGSGSSAYVITRDNAYITPSLAALMDSRGVDEIAVSRFDVDGGRRGEDTGRDTSRLVLGGNGVITGNWEYDASVNYGVTDETRHNLNNRINDRFYASIDAVRDAAGNIVCRSTLDPTSINPNVGDVLNPIALGGGCVPTSVFGTGAINPAAANWFNTTTTTKSRITQFVGGGTVTNNNLFAMPGDAGSVSVVAGAEFRRETSRQDTDPLDVAGLTFLNAIPPFSGAYDVKEGYVETAVPLLGGLSFAKNLTFDAAARFSDYSTIGHTKAWRWGLDWSIDDNIRLRGTMSSAVRAPNIGELFSGQSQNFFTIVDPCSANQLDNAKSRQVREANCAALGIPSGFQSVNQATVEGLSGSNPNLQSELGRTWTAGFVFTPTFLEGLGLSVDYWNIRLTNAISAPSGTDVVNRCVDSPTGIDNVYCQSTTRDPETNEIIFISSLNQNIAALQTSGIDLSLTYGVDMGPGKMRWKLDATKVIAYTEFPFQDDKDESIQDNGTLGFPKWKASLMTTYLLNNWTINWNMRYFSSMLRVSNESFNSNPTSTSPIKAGAGFFNDARVSYSFKGGWQAYAGVTNVFDRNPPVNIFGNTFGGGLYDNMGRSYYAGFNYNF